MGSHWHTTMFSTNIDESTFLVTFWSSFTIALSILMFIGKLRTLQSMDPSYDSDPKQSDKDTTHTSPESTSKEYLLTKVDIPLIQEELLELKEAHTFGIQRWKHGPFIPFTDLTFTNGKLYCIVNGEKKSVAKVVADRKRTTRPRWIHHLCFLKNGKDGSPILFKDHLQETHGLIFS
jgi:hypothetical protein